MTLPKTDAYYTCEKLECGEYLYYFAPALRHKPPYLKQIRVEAIIDIAEDGSLAGIELIDNMPRPFGSVKMDK